MPARDVPPVGGNGRRSPQDTCNAKYFFFPALNMSGYDSGDDISYIQMNYPSTGHVDPLYGTTIKGAGTTPNEVKNIYIRKTYVKASVSNEFIYDDPENVYYGVGFPRAIVSIASPITLNSSNYLGGGDRASLNNKLVPVIAMEDLAIMTYRSGNKVPVEVVNMVGALLNNFFAAWLAKLGSGGAGVNPIKSPSQPAVGGDVTGDDANITPGGATFGSWMEHMKSVLNRDIAPKAAMAGFAAIPLESQQFVYGPWMNYPDLQKNKIFPHLNTSQRPTAIESMTGKSHVVVDRDLVPENYNGMFLLDQAVSELLESETSYQQKFETGSVSIPGLPIFSLGDQLAEYGSSINYYVPKDAASPGYGVMRRKATVNIGPNITNISVQFGRQPDTRYTFKTYTSKLNIFNKRNADTIRSLAQRNRRARRDLYNLLNKSYKSLNEAFQKGNNFRDRLLASAVVGAGGGKKPDDTSGTSPTEIMAGSIYDFSGRITGMGGVYQNVKRSNIGIYESKEVSREIVSSYSFKSFMSMDGFYSPVSFYPTKFGHTIPFTKFQTARCPVCNGSKKYQQVVFQGGGQILKDTYCDYCTRGDQFQSVKRIKSPNYPPFILASGLKVTVRESVGGDPSDSVVYEYISDKNLIRNPRNFLKSLTGGGFVGDIPVNLITLNPIIAVSGLFRNTNADKNDFGGHSIEVVGRGYVAPKDLNIVDEIVNGGVVGAGTSRSDQTARKADATSQSLGVTIPKAFADLDYRTYDARVNMNQTQKILYDMNQRFFSFKGPMVLHGWGYDLDGYPVPNASGNPINFGTYKPDAAGNIWRTKSLDVEGSNDPNSSDYGDIVVGQNMRWNSTDRKWSEPKKEKYFMDSWGLRQEQWPVGPIDLRWDDTRRVWTAFAEKPFDNVYVTLEEDLILEQNSKNSYPTRGFLDDIDFDKEPIPSGMRRVVFVKDRSGYTAPRGARLFCSYDRTSGFYQPLSQPTITCFGVLKQGLNAEIFANYAEPSNGLAQDVKVVNIKFVNKMNLQLKPDHNAVFIYMDGAWNLMSIGEMP